MSKKKKSLKLNKIKNVLKQSEGKTSLMPLSIGVLVFSFALVFLTFAWTEPTQGPPNGNVAAPINVGSTAQTKAGDLTISNLSLDATANEGNISNLNEIIGYNDLFLKGDSGETSAIHIAGSQISSYTNSTERMRIDSAGNVGIGMTNPYTELNLPATNAVTGGIMYGNRALTGQKVGRLKVGSYTANEEPVTMFYADANSGYNLVYYGGGSGLENAATELRFFTADAVNKLTGIERLRIDSSGNIQVLQGNLYAALGISTYDTTVADGTIEATEFCLANGSECVSGTWPSGGVSGWIKEGAVVRLQTASDVVGVGTASVDENYKITTAGGGIKAESSIADEPAGYFSNPAGYALVTLDGNVGIGTTSPGDKLHVYESVGSSFTTSMRLSGNPAIGGGNAIFFKASGNETDDRYGVKLGAIRSDANNGAAEFVIQLEKSGLGGMEDVFRIDDSGNVGIGTVTPGRNLDVSGIIGVEDAGENEKIYLYAASTGADVSFSGNAGQVRIDTRTANNVYFNSGNVGIGTASPGQNLHIRDASANAIMRLDADSGSGRTYELISDINGKFSIKDLDNSITRLLIDTDGDVGIGTTSPDANLHLYTGTFLLGTSAAKQFRIRDTGSAVDIESVGVPLYINNTSGEEVYLMGGDVGIGTTNPGYKLDVNGNVNATQLCIDTDCRGVWPSEGSNLWTEAGSNIYYDTGNVGIGNPTPGYKLDVTGTIRATGSIYSHYSNIGNLNTALGIGQSLEYGNVDVATLRFDSDRWRLYAGGGGGEIFTVQQGGNVGITGDLTVSGASTNFQNAIKAVDGSGSGIDADLLDGSHASAFAPVSLTSLNIADTRNDGDVVPDGFTDKDVKFSFTDEITLSPNTWDSVITMKGWGDGYKAWQLMSNSSNSGGDDLYFRSGIGTSWGSLRRVIVEESNGNVGIGILGPIEKLHVQGNAVITGAYYGAASGAPDSTIWAVSPTYSSYGIFYNEGSPDKIEFKEGGNVNSWIALNGDAHFGRIQILNGDGRGIRFWNGDSRYAIYMSDADPDRGGVTPYSLTFKMSDINTRGFRWCNENECGMSLESYTGQWNLNVANNIYAAAFYYNSDIRTKKDIKELDSSFSISSILSLNPVSFKFKENDQPGLGFIAQDLEKIYPELISTDDDEEGMKSINYAGLIAPLVKTVQEQQSMIEEQNQRIEKLENLYNEQ